MSPAIAIVPTPYVNPECQAFSKKTSSHVLSIDYYLRTLYIHLVLFKEHLLCATGGGPAWEREQHLRRHCIGHSSLLKGWSAKWGCQCHQGAY